MDTSTRGQLQTFSLETLPDTPNATSSQESGAGRLPSTLQDGPELDLFGQVLAPASHSAQLESGKAKTTNGMSGRNSFGSFESVALTQSLANRLKERLGTVGSMEYSQTWKEKVTPAGRLYWAHTARAHPTSDSGCTGWPTPKASESQESVESVTARRQRLREQGDTKTGNLLNLSQAVQIAGWPTPRTEKHNPQQRSDFTPNLAAVAGWATPTSKDHKDGPPCPNVETNALLGRQVWLSHVPTENRGALNPEFSCWLMGYPPEWCECAVTAMQSFRKSRRNS